MNALDSRAWTGLLIAGCTAAHVPVAAAGTVWVVDDDGGSGVDFTELQAAVDAAGPGDVVLVRAGDYGSLSIDGVGLTVVADADASVRVAAPWIVSGVPTGELVVLRGLEVGVSGAKVVEILGCAGSVWLEDCLLVASASTGAGEDAVRIEQSEAVLLARCTVTAGDSITTGFVGPPAAGGSAVHVRGSRLAVFDCDLVGGNGGHAPAESSSSGADGGDGLRLVSSEAFVAGGSSAGGSGGQGGQVFIPPLGPLECGDGGDGGSGVRAVAATGVPFFESGSELTLRDHSAAGGGGGASPCAGPGGAGDALLIESGAPHEVVQLAGSARGFSVNGPVRGGNNARLEFSGQPGDLAFGLVGAPAAWLPLEVQPAPLMLGQVLALVGPWTLPGSGTTIQPIPVPLQAPGFGGATLPLQGVLVEVESGQLALAPGTALVILNQAL
ncbi:hypothetical protein [Engelhardtia mirabilis]|uniref:DUF1565 domain-containing protein n=1 Tax=Engelhardtia mirabilis TaxID=2528011 RepID=A0A518BH27_9BACT|nr:hypothetical protein Pla133_13550 [Planctomycetes bacterium Pla133]QDV00614.1 hypothetical protein Pla86_13540 [Planctomycetes bacterium Pla86]